MIKKYSKESMEELGSYVYIFSKDGDVLKALQEGQQFQYGGKGVDKRTLTHTLSEEAGGKGYSLDDVFIIMRNGEKYLENTKPHEIAAFAVEALLIKLYDPTDNKVQGRNHECFVMKHLSEIDAEFRAKQINPAQECLKFYTKYTDLHSIVTGHRSGTTSYEFKTSRNAGIEYKLYVKPGVENNELTIKVNIGKEYGGLNQQELKAKWIKDNSHIEWSDDGEHIAIHDFGSEEDTVEFFVEAANNE
jgi:hypothetical protein